MLRAGARARVFGCAVGFVGEGEGERGMVGWCRIGEELDKGREREREKVRSFSFLMH
jgi:hypothetical protein